MSQQIYPFFSNRHPFSNWFPIHFEVRGFHFNCTEQMMMFGKAKLFGDEDTALRILDAITPKDQKALGRSVRWFDERVWVARREGIVYQANYAKFSQNKEQGRLLLSTNDKILVEASQFDRIWGCGLAHDHPDINYPEKWLGLNLQGKSLERVRAQLALDELNNG